MSDLRKDDNWIVKLESGQQFPKWTSILVKTFGVLTLVGTIIAGIAILVGTFDPHSGPLVAFGLFLSLCINVIIGILIVRLCWDRANKIGDLGSESHFSLIPMIVVLIRLSGEVGFIFLIGAGIQALLLSISGIFRDFDFIAGLFSIVACIFGGVVHLIVMYYLAECLKLFADMATNLKKIEERLSDEGDRPQSIGEGRVASEEETPRNENVQPSVPASAPQAEEQRQEEATERAKSEEDQAEEQRQEEEFVARDQTAEEQRQEEEFVARVRRKPSPSGVNSVGETDLHLVAALNLDMLTLSLLKHGADIHAKTNAGNTPLHLAARGNAGATAELLLKQGADIHAEDNFGNTPLHVAAGKDAHETAEVLLNHGADVQAKNNEGNTPLQVAARNNAGATAELLRRYGV